MTSQFTFRLPILVQELENDTALAEGLGVPIFQRFGADDGKLIRNLGESIARYLANKELLEVHAHHLQADVTVAEVSLNVSSRTRDKRWPDPVRLTFPYVCWGAGGQVIAYVPALSIHLLVKAREEVATRLANEIRYALRRFGLDNDLATLAELQRVSNIRIETHEISPGYLSPKQRERQNLKEETPKPVMPDVAVSLTGAKLAPAFETEDIVARLARHLAPPASRSVLLIGPSGVGKTAVVNETARRRGALGLGETPFWSTSGSRLVAGMSGFGEWQERTQKFLREVKAAGAVVHIGALSELMAVGRSISSDQGIADLFKPYLSRGEVVVIAECMPTELPVIDKADPHLLSLFDHVEIAPAGREKVRSILLSAASMWEKQYRVSIDVDAVVEIERLYHRHAAYSAAPGGAVGFLAGILTHREGDPTAPVTAGEVVARFSYQSGLPLFLLDEAIPLDIGETRRWFQTRLKGQDEAVTLVVDLIAALKCRLTRPEKPPFTLLFVGPTGVGKTELAKLLAEYLFSDACRMTRFDMSEYSDPLAVERLIGGLGGEGRLTAKIREQPFSVVLFDELEKADPRFFDFLLQILGEGRLTDRSGRLADFTSSVVIMTSNIASHIYQKGAVGFGAAGPGSGDADRVLEEVTRFFRPELINRIDRIVPFSPLPKTAVHEIAVRALDALKSRDGVRERRLNLVFEGDVPVRLSENGVDPKWGARPLRRNIDRQILAPLADRLARSGAETDMTATIRVEGGVPKVAMQRTKSTGSKQGPDSAGLAEIQTLRRKAQKALAGDRMRELKNHIFRLEKQMASLERRRRRHPRLTAELEACAKSVEQKQAVQDLVHSTYHRICERETLLLRHYLRMDSSGGPSVESVSDLAAGLADAWDHLYREGVRAPNRIILAIFSEHTDPVRRLATAYHRYLLGIDASFTMSFWEMKKDETRQEEVPIQIKVDRFEKLFAKSAPGIVGVSFEASAPGVYLKLNAEAGVHQFEAKEKNNAYLKVHVSEEESAGYRPPPQVLQRATKKQVTARRIYDERGMLMDKHLDEKVGFTGSDFSDALRILIDRAYVNRVEKAVTQ